MKKTKTMTKTYFFRKAWVFSMRVHQSLSRLGGLVNVDCLETKGEGVEEEELDLGLWQVRTMRNYELGARWCESKTKQNKKTQGYWSLSLIYHNQFTNVKNRFDERVCLYCDVDGMKR